jgi:thymidylate synthase ThyX
MNANIEVGITDKFDPEVQAMLLAMYSRSYGPIADRLPDSEQSANEHKLKLGKYYINWGHKSVGQLGVTTVWLEGVSQLAAKAIENHPLFNGQESSTRYINYGTQPAIIPNSLDVEIQRELDYWQTTWTDFYNKALPVVVKKLKKDYPFEEQYKHLPLPELDDPAYIKAFTTWENTIKARAFDKCRGYLVAGSVTNVGFLGTFDTLNDHFGEMLHHPCSEMRGIANEVLTKMKEKYPYGTMPVDELFHRYSYVDNSFFYTNGESCRSGHQVIVDREDLSSQNEAEQEFMNERLIKYLTQRKKGQRIDRVTASKLMFTMRGYIDFGSYRDLHRHRAGVCDMRILTPGNGIHSYYSEDLSDELKAELEVISSNFSNWYTKTITHSPGSVYELQYSVPMGYMIHVTYKCDINQVLYLLELRSGKTVHNTLRHLIHEWGKVIYSSFGDSIKIHIDYDVDNFTLKRGTQTIVADTENVNDERISI